MIHHAGDLQRSPTLANAQDLHVKKQPRLQCAKEIMVRRLGDIRCASAGLREHSRIRPPPDRRPRGGARLRGVGLKPCWGLFITFHAYIISRKPQDVLLNGAPRPTLVVGAVFKVFLF